MKKFFYQMIAILIVAVFIVSCGKDSGISADEYIALNNLETKELDEGVHIVIHKPGNNAKPNINSKVTVAYEGRLTDGTVFDSNENAIFQMTQLIEGWRIGLKEIGVGGSCTLIVPPNAGYGSSGAGSSIPGNATLVFDMELKKVE